MKNTIQNITYDMIREALIKGEMWGYVKRTTIDKMLKILDKEMRWEK